MRNFPFPSRRSRTSCSVLALATVLVVGATPAMAQSLLGSGSFTTNGGAGASIGTAPNLTTINVNPGQTVIDWIPTDTAIGGGTINFQNPGTTANFLGSPGFAVLNRINPADSTRSITMNGTIQTLALGTGAATNGSLYFYTPGGFVIGGNSVINVGSLVLSTSPITVNGSGQFITGASNSVTFGQASQPGASIVTNGGSQINATASDAYVAMVAPRVQHGGTINVAGSAALVGAEAATINFSPDGLFDIQVTTGTTDANGVSVSGTITGAASTGGSDIHRAYLVAVPKNAAITMLVANGSSLGFDVAGAANVVGNTVVLSSGHNVTDGAIESAPATAGSGFDAHLQINGTNMSSALVAAATGNADIFSSVGQSSNFASDVTMRGIDRARVGASGFTTTVNIAGNLDLSATQSIDIDGLDATGGLVEVYALNNASVSVTGSTNLVSNGTGGGSAATGIIGGDGFGGDITVTAQTGGDITLNGGLAVTANGYGGFASALNANGGNGTGGDVVVNASGSGSSIAVNGNLTIVADGLAGSGSGLECFTCDGDGGVGTGGTVDLRALASGLLTLSGAGNTISTNGVGGHSGRSDGGNAFGGSLTRIYANGVGSAVTTSGSMTISASATGGNASFGDGGTADGGDIDIFAQNGGNVLFDSSLTAAANGMGGTGAASGGDGSGGSVTIFSTATLQVDGTLNAAANATGGGLYSSVSIGNSAGDGLGGDVDVYAQNGALTLVGAVNLSTNATGGQVADNGDLAGDAVGGTTRLFASAGGVINLQSTLNASAIGSGGGTDYSNAGIGGDGQGGAVRVQSTAANASVTIAGVAELDASGEGSGSSGGNGTGGTVWADSFGAATARLDFQSDVALYAQGLGGDHNNGTGGNGQGGQALLQASAGSTLSVGGNALVDTAAFGGYSNASTAGVGGNAIGGQSRIQTFGGTGAGGTLAIVGSATVSANGLGGETYSNVGGVAGNGTGGSAHVITTLGNITIGTPGSGGSVDITANGSGGESDDGVGGNGTGGSFARLEAVNGDITIAGYAVVSASGTGGDGVRGGGIGLGSGIATTNTTPGVGGAHIFARNGDVVINGGASVSSVGIGGDAISDSGYGGDYGAAGGNGTGGWATIFAANSDLGPSTIRIVAGNIEGSGFASINVGGAGGDGGVGASGNLGGNGGIGGIGRGGTAIFTAAAGNGSVTIEGASAYASGSGGAGGRGGNGVSLSGGNGGNGGGGFGGVINIGTESGSGQSAAVNNGVGDYGSIIADSSASGGDGGDGGTGTGTGDGGNGGSAVAGSSVLLVRGSLVDVGTVTLIANATGGNGGEGDGDGNGGSATVGGTGGIAVVVTERLSTPAQRGTLTAGDIRGTAIATGGTGASNGISQTLGGNLVVFRNSGGSLGSLDFLVQAATIGTGAVEDAIAVVNGDVAVDGTFDFVTGGTLSLLLDNASVDAGLITLRAANFVPDTVTVTPANAGTFFANSFDIQTGNNFVTTANLDSNQALTIVAPGAIQIGNVTGGDDVRLTSGGNMVTGSIQSDDDVALVAGGSISTLDIFAYDDVTGEAGTTITTDDITGNSINLFAGGAIVTDDLLTQNFLIIEAAPPLVPGSSVSIVSAQNITLGNVDAIDGVNLSSDRAIATGTILADSFVRMDADGAITAGNITAGTTIDTLSGGAQALANLTAGNAIELDSLGGITFGNSIAGSVDFTSGGAVTGGNITARNYAIGEAQGAIVLGNVTTTAASPIDEFSVGFASATSIAIGNVVGVDEVGLATSGNLTAGTILAGNLAMALVGGNMTVGSITTTTSGRVYLADSSMVAIGNGIDDFDPAIVLALAPVATGRSITINGPVVTGRFQAAAGDNLSARAITANRIEASAGNVATIDGMWRAGQVSLRSGDIAITANGGIDAGTSGSILLNAVRTSGGALIGDGLTGTGYALSNAEFGRISGGEIQIVAGGFGGNANMVIGDLTITGPLAGSNIESNDGGLEFITLQANGAALDGTLRVAGDVMVTGLGADNYLGFYTQNFELDAATGTISLTGNAGALAGTLEIYASRIHVAEGSLLDQLAANPQFAGYREALNRQAAVARPDGVIRAANFDIEFGTTGNAGPYTLFVQNMGTTTVPAGFLLSAANISDDGEGALAPGSVDMAINGQIITPTGTLTGIAVRDLLVTEFGTTAFATGSTINGCLLTGSCSATPLQIDTIARTDVQINDPGNLGDGLFGNEPDIDDGEDGDEGDLSSPIAAPVPLFDSRPLTGESDVNDPISGAGNPSLMGTSEDDTEVCDSSTGKECKTTKKGDGK